jgi:hypothetical protein
MNIYKLYYTLFYAGVGKPSPYLGREEQVANAYWLISLLQGVNVSSLIFLFFTFSKQPMLPPWLIGIMFSTPLIFNYFFFLQRGRKKIIKEVDDLIVEGKLKSMFFVGKYLILTIVFQALSATIYSFYG